MYKKSGLVLKGYDRKGDVDLSGEVDLTDAMKVFQYVAGYTILTYPDLGHFLSIADISNNGIVDLSDAMKIFQLVAGKIDNFD